MERRQALNERLSDCKLRLRRVRRKTSRVSKTTEVQPIVPPIHTFTNLRFDSGKTALPAGTKKQLDEIAYALQQTHPSQIIKIHRHADVQLFWHASVAESDRRNLQLSRDRAETIINALVDRGIPETRLKIHRHSHKQPLVRGMSPDALATNRRVDIEVMPAVTQSADD